MLLQLPALVGLVFPILTSSLAPGEERVASDTREKTVVLESVRGAEDGETVTVRLLAGPDEASDTHYVVVGDAPPAGAKLPSVWIGVRIMPVPAPLAAHIGEDGVMISNVFKGSPADEAGVERYDVFLEFDGMPVNSPADLSKVVGATAAGERVQVVLVRGADEQTLTMRPAKRAENMELELKYDEPEEEVLAEKLNLRGRTLQVGPGGEWIMRDLGELQGVPDVLEELKGLDLDVHVEGLPKAFMGDGPDNWIHIPSPGPFMWRGGDGRELEVEVKIRIEEDGSTTVIETDKDGRIHVTQSDADGNETTDTYENEAALCENHPELYAIYRQHVGRPTGLFHRSRPEKLKKWRQEFQVDIREQLEKAREQVEATQRQLKKKYVRPHADRPERNDDVRRRVPDAPAKDAKRGDRPGTVTEDSRALGVRVADDGAITVYFASNGEVSTYRFVDRESFRTAEPELYAQVEDLLE